jgi:geranylgeranyl diphosphate synthase type II
MSYLDQLAKYREPTLQTLLKAIPQDKSQPYLYEIIHDFLSTTGKGIRPALCLATCGAHGGRIEEALNSAAAIELLHNAFLVHDDIEDLSEMRRNRPTVHVRYGVPLAVNTGDAMQALSLRLLCNNSAIVGPEIGWNIFEEFFHLLMRSLEGQALELGWIRNNDFSLVPEDYIRMVLGKTCWYSFIHPCRIGALIAWRGQGDLDTFNEFACYLGVLFQIQDDILNLTGREEYGKESAGDLYEGKRTLMLLHLFQNSGEAEKRELDRIFAKARPDRMPGEISWIYDLMQKRGSIDFARGVAQQFYQAAEKTFDVAYARAEENEHKQFLRGLLRFMETREL